MQCISIRRQVCWRLKTEINKSFQFWYWFPYSSSNSSWLNLNRKTKFPFLLIQHLKVLVFFIKFHIIFNHSLPPPPHPPSSAMFSRKLHYFVSHANSSWVTLSPVSEILSQSKFIPTVTRKYCNKCNLSDFIEQMSINMQHQLCLYLLL